MEWQDISTAPIDKTILVRDFNEDHFEAYQLPNGAWRAQDPRGRGCCYLANKPDLWMPLPKPSEDIA